MQFDITAAPAHCPLWLLQSVLIIIKAESPVHVLQFLGGENMLTGHTNEHWKAVRKAVAPAFSAGNMR